VSPHTLTDEPNAVDGQPTMAPAPGSTPRPRLTVREMQIALDAARSRLTQPDAARGVTDKDERGGADRSHAAPCHDALEGSSSATVPIVAPPHPTEPAPTRRDRNAEPTDGESWLPDHDGPVTLTGIATPRTRSPRRSSPARPDKSARRPAAPQPDRPAKAARIGAELAAAISADPPRIAVVPACGGAGATTSAVLLASALAQARTALLLAGGHDCGSLALRSNADGADLEALAAWAREHPQQPLRRDSPGLAIGTVACGERLLVAAERRGAQSAAPVGLATVAALLAAATTTHASVVLDWCTGTPMPDRLLAAATHLVVVAPATSPGLLDAEYAVEQLEATRARHAALSLLTVDVRGRAPRRAGRAALARLRALDIPVGRVPYDPALADDPRVSWPSLRPRTRAAVSAALTQLLQREEAT
jgi:hypothetical protein